MGVDGSLLLACADLDVGVVGGRWPRSDFVDE